MKAFSFKDVTYLWHAHELFLIFYFIRTMHRRNMVESETLFFDSVSSGKFEAIPDDLTPEEILEQAQRAAQAAADRLTLKRPNTNVCV
jgi:hypothetical protein